MPGTSRWTSATRRWFSRTATCCSCSTGTPRPRSPTTNCPCRRRASMCPCSRPTSGVSAEEIAAGASSAPTKTSRRRQTARPVPSGTGRAVLSSGRDDPHRPERAGTRSHNRGCRQRGGLSGRDVPGLRQFVGRKWRAWGAQQRWSAGKGGRRTGRKVPGRTSATPLRQPVGAPGR